MPYLKGTAVQLQQELMPCVPLFLDILILHKSQKSKHVKSLNFYIQQLTHNIKHYMVQINMPLSLMPPVNLELITSASDDSKT